MEEEVTYMQKFMKVTTNDDKTIEVSSQLCNFCKYFQQILQDTAISEPIVIDIPSNIFEKIIEYFKYYEFQPIRFNFPKPLPNGDLQKFLNNFDYQFIYQFNEDELIELIEASNNLNCDELLQLGCLRIAAKFKEQTFDEVKELYGIEAEFNQNLKDKFSQKYDYLIEPKQ